MKSNIKNVFKVLVLCLIYSATLTLNAQELKNMENKNGLIVKESSRSFESTHELLKGAIESNPNLTLLFELDHSANAKKVGLALCATRILFFGNPKVGTQFMDASATTAIDLPQKIMIYQGDNNIVNVVYNDPYYLKSRHQITDDQNELLSKVATLLDKITDSVL